MQSVFASKFYVRCVALLFSSCVLVDPATALAQTAALESPNASPDTERARDEFRLGASLSKVARWDEARDAFARSYALRRHAVTSYNLAFCERALGHPSLAIVLFERALSEGAAGNGDRLPEPLAVLTARYLGEAKARAARLVVHLRGATRLSVDGVPVARVDRGAETEYVAGAGAPANLAGTESVTVRLDPGLRVLIASRPGQTDRVVSRRFEPSERATVALAWDTRTAAPELRPPAPTPVSESRRWAYVALGSGVAALAASGVAVYTARRKYDYLDDRCPSNGECSERYASDIQALERYADIATVSAVIGLAGIASGVTLFALPGTVDTGRKMAPRVSVRSGGGGGLLVVSGQVD